MDNLKRLTFISRKEYNQILNKISGTNKWTITLDFSLIKSEKELYAFLKPIIPLPDYFGGNLNALLDCLDDAELLEHKKLDIFILNTNLISDKQFLRYLLSTFNMAVEYWSERKDQLKVIVVRDGDYEN